ncbi:hypothetical protein ACO11K_001537 [Bacillus cytotoxicus]
MSNQILEKRIDALEKLVAYKQGAINELACRVIQLEECVKDLRAQVNRK